MEILFINPPYGGGLKNQSSQEPIGLLYICEYLLGQGIAVDLVDYTMEEFDLEKLLARAAEFKFIGFPSFSCNIGFIYRLSKQIKERFPDKLQFIGGAHATFRREEVFANSDIDFIVCGEGEEKILNLILNHKDPNCLTSGVFYRTEQGFKGEYKGGLFIKNLDDLPYPYEIRKRLPYKYDRLNIITSRGCPNNCYFCVSPALWERKVRYRSIELVIQEISKALKISENHYRYLNILDDNFLLDKERVKKFCLLLKQEDIKLPWGCYSRIDTFDQDLAEILTKSGCVKVKFGIESGSKRIQKIINKKINFRKARRIFKTLDRLKIESSASFIIGLPEENLFDMVKTLFAALYLQPGRAAFFLANAYPGTRLFEGLGKRKPSLEDYSFWENSCKHYLEGSIGKYSAKFLNNLIKIFYFVFYFFNRGRRNLLDSDFKFYLRQQGLLKDTCQLKK